MMKKCDFSYAAYFLIGVILLVIMPLGFFLSVEILMGMLGYTETKVFLKDHGSLIAGLAAVVVAVVTILFHGKYSRDQINESRKLSEETKFLEKKEEVLFILLNSRRLLERVRLEYLKNDDIVAQKALSVEIRDEALMASTIADAYNIPYKDELFIYAELANMVSYAMRFRELSQSSSGDVLHDMVQLVDLEDLTLCMMRSYRCPDDLAGGSLMRIFMKIQNNRKEALSNAASEVIGISLYEMYSIRGAIFYNIANQSSLNEDE